MKYTVAKNIWVHFKHPLGDALFFLYKSHAHDWMVGVNTLLHTHHLPLYFSISGLAQSVSSKGYVNPKLMGFKIFLRYALLMMLYPYPCNNINNLLVCFSVTCPKCMVATSCFVLCLDLLLFSQRFVLILLPCNVICVHGNVTIRYYLFLADVCSWHLHLEIYVLFVMYVLHVFVTTFFFIIELYRSIFDNIEL